MTGIEVTKARVERSEGGWESIHDLSITAKQCAIIDFVGQFCREYKIPHAKGLDIRYLECSEFCIQAGVEVLDNLGGRIIIEFLVQKNKNIGSYGWEVFTPNSFPCSTTLPNKTKFKFKVLCGLNGKYRFTPLS